MTSDDLVTALLVERQILQDKFPLACGCAVTSTYGHPARRDWRLVNGYIAACPSHNKPYISLDREKKQEWTKGSFIPKWRDEQGLWVLRDEWNVAVHPECTFQYKGGLYLLLLGYLGTPVVLGEEKGDKMAGRAITLNLGTGKTFPAPVPEEMLQRFGWRDRG